MKNAKRKSQDQRVCLVGQCDVTEQGFGDVHPVFFDGMTIRTFSAACLSGRVKTLTTARAVLRHFARANGEVALVAIPIPVAKEVFGWEDADFSGAEESNGAVGRSSEGRQPSAPERIFVVSTPDLFPNGGTWYLNSPAMGRPSIHVVQGTSMAKSNTGVLCFRTEALAVDYLRRLGASPEEFPPVYVEHIHLHEWIKSCTKCATYLIWPAWSEQTQTFKHQCISIRRFLNEMKAA